VDSDLFMQQQTASMKQGADNAPPPPYVDGFKIPEAVPGVK